MAGGKDVVAELNGNPLPFAQLLGIVFVSAEPERVVAECRSARNSAPGPTSATAAR